MNRKILSAVLLISILLTASCGSSPDPETVSGDDTSASSTDTSH